MSAAVMCAQPVPFPAVFKGDSEQCLEELIAACQRKPTGCATYSGWGRELVPAASSWLGMDDGALDQSSRAHPRGSAPAHASVSPSGKHPRYTNRAPESPEHKKRSKQQHASAAPTPAAAVRRASSGGSSSSSGYACPALAASPKPEQLPMPTTGLLSRALVRGRSPSPPKDAYATSETKYYQSPVCAMA